jgi:hypothetical protein
MSFDLTLAIEEDMPPNVLNLVVDGEDVTIQLSPRLERSVLFVLDHDVRDKINRALDEKPWEEQT